MKRETILEIVRIICRNDEDMVGEIGDLILSRDCANGEEILQEITDSLDDNYYVAIRDWKDEIEDFIYFLENTNGVKSLGLEIDEDWLDENGSIAEWCSILDEKWNPMGCCVGSIDIGTDSYVLFACREEEMKRLRGLAKKLNIKIDCARKM